MIEGWGNLSRFQSVAEKIEEYNQKVRKVGQVVS
jgi:hypothetical protein